MKKNGKNFGSDFTKVDAHLVTEQEYEELPMLTDEMLARGVFKKAGRPVKENKKISIHLRIDPEVNQAFRKTGKGWQTLMNEILKQWVDAHP